MSNVKAQLTVVLKADETVVAETNDPVLWQRVLVAIQRGTASPLDDDPSSGTKSEKQNPVSDDPERGGDAESRAIEKFASHLGLEQEAVVGACAPSLQEPYLHLDVHCWEDMKNKLPERGPTALGPIAPAGTLLALWFRAAGLGSPTQSQAAAVLETIHVRDRNPGRGIQRAFWLQARPGGVFVINPAQVSKALAIGKAFCARQWAGDEMKKG